VIGTSFLTAAIAVLGLTVFSDDTLKAPALLEGKIWFNSDTLDLGKNDTGDSLLTLPGKTVVDEESESIDEDKNLFSGNITELPPRAISQNANLLKLKLLLPGNLKFIKDAPIELAAKSSDPEIIKIGKIRDQNPEKTLTFPISVKPGEADLFLYYKVVCCTTGIGSVCFFEEANLKVRIEIGDFEDDVLEIRHEIKD